MAASLEFLLGLLDHPSPHAAWEDFQGPHGKALRLGQRMGFVSRYPGMHPAPSCPHCAEGTPYLLGERYICPHCLSTVDRQHLLVWPLHLDVFLGWLAARLHLRGDVRPMDGQLWQLGTGEEEGVRFACFYSRGGALTDAEKGRIGRYRQTVLLFGSARPSMSDIPGPCVYLLEILTLGRALTVAKGATLLHRGGRVRFDPRTGKVSAGDIVLGEVPVGSKEFFLVQCLAQQLDTFVPYADIKGSVVYRTGSADQTEEATFCQLLKSRIKKKWIPDIDRLIVTSNKAEGYRLRGSV